MSGARARNTHHRKTTPFAVAVKAPTNLSATAAIANRWIDSTTYGNIVVAYKKDGIKPVSKTIYREV